MLKTTPLTACTAANGFLAVLLGALGAHALKDTLSAQNTLGSWQTASHYHLAHVLGTLALLAWSAAQPEKASSLHRVGWFWQAGCLLFAGSIYILALGGPRILGPITPLGGLAFLAGWVLLGAQSLRQTKTP